MISLQAEMSAVLPAPVSPEITVRRGEGASAASLMRARSRTRISSIMSASLEIDEVEHDAALGLDVVEELGRGHPLDGA